MSLSLNEWTFGYTGSNNNFWAIIWTNAGILLIWMLRTNFSEILSEINTISFKKMHLKMSTMKWRYFCLSLNVLRVQVHQRVRYILSKKLGHYLNDSFLSAKNKAVAYVQFTGVIWAWNWDEVGHIGDTNKNWLIKRRPIVYEKFLWFLGMEYTSFEYSHPKLSLGCNYSSRPQHQWWLANLWKKSGNG